MEPQLNKQQPP